MPLILSRIFLVSSLILSMAAMPDIAKATPQGGIRAAQKNNLRATADLRARFTSTQQRIAHAERNRAITRSRAAALRRQVAQAKAEMTRLARQQGFVSAAELASYNRTLGTIDVELDRRGVARSFGNDGLVHQSPAE